MRTPFYSNLAVTSHLVRELVSFSLSNLHILRRNRGMELFRIMKNITNCFQRNTCIIGAQEKVISMIIHLFHSIATVFRKKSKISESIVS